MSKPNVTASRSLNSRRHSVASMHPPPTSSSVFTTPTTAVENSRHLSVPNGNHYHDNRRGSLTAINESSPSGKTNGILLNSGHSASKTRRRSVVIISPTHDKSPLSSKPSSRRTSVCSRPEAAVSGEEMSADQLINDLVKEVDDAILNERRDSLPQASDEFAQIMNEMSGRSLVTASGQS